MSEASLEVQDQHTHHADGLFAGRVHRGKLLSGDGIDELAVDEELGRERDLHAVHVSALLRNGCHLHSSPKLSEHESEEGAVARRGENLLGSQVTPPGPKPSESLTGKCTRPSAPGVFFFSDMYMYI